MCISIYIYMCVSVFIYAYTYIYMIHKGKKKNIENIVGKPYSGSSHDAGNTFHQLTLHTPAGRRKIFYSFQNNPANKKPPQLFLSFKELSFKTVPPNLLLSSIKEQSLPLFFRLAFVWLWFASPKLQFLCYFKINSISG